jgi:hypothetical protein
MKAKLKFNLEFPDERKAHMRCVKSTDMAIVLFDILYNAKKKIHHENESEAFVEGIDSTLNYIRELCEDRNINIDELLD